MVEQEIFPDGVVLCLDVYLIPGVVRYKCTVVAQAALVDVNVKGISLIRERCDQVIAGCNVLVGDAVAILRFLLCHEQISLDEDQCIWLETCGYPSPRRDSAHKNFPVFQCRTH